MPAGESLVRQLLYGQRYFRARFGAEHTVCWLPDCFGFTPALPQLLRGAGIERFFTIKLSWSETNRFPHDLFWWEGLDGTRVLAHMFDNPDGGYNGVVGPASALATWRNSRGREPTRRACSRSATATAAAGRPGDGRARARAGRLPGAARPALRPRRRVLRPRGAQRGRARSADLGRRAVPGAAPGDADHPGPHEARAPPRRARPRRGRGARRPGGAGRRGAAAVARAAVARAAAQRVPRHPAGLEHPRGRRGRRGRARRGDRRGRGGDRRAAGRAGRAAGGRRRGRGAAGRQPRPLPAAAARACRWRSRRAALAGGGAW